MSTFGCVTPQSRCRNVPDTDTDMPTATPGHYEPDPAHRVKRIAYRARYDAPTVHAILDGGYVCHISFIDEGCPQVIPMTYWRDGEFVYFHAAAKGRFAAACSSGDIAIAVTLMDALVLGHSPINHSMNFRSVVLRGRPEVIGDRRSKAAAMHSFFDKTIPGRWEDLRAVRDDELDAMTVFRLRLDQVAAKIRNEFPDDEQHMPEQPVWTGIVPTRPVFQAPVTDPRHPARPIPAYLAQFSGKPDFTARVENSGDPSTSRPAASPVSS
jgi:nitroimidazol reductase NimA-like FMN-containing flavoprotein (pyridoxamine 5'-phosphate oxidase superfamily)